jgi:hypothetical protein
METGHRMYGKEQLVFVPAKLSKEATLFEVSEAERLGQEGEKRDGRNIILKMLQGSCFPRFGVCVRCAVSGSWQEGA